MDVRRAGRALGAAIAIAGADGGLVRAHGRSPASGGQGWVGAPASARGARLLPRPSVREDWLGRSGVAVRLEPLPVSAAFHAGRWPDAARVAGAAAAGA